MTVPPSDNWVNIFSLQKVIPEYAELALGDSFATRALDYVSRWMYEIPPENLVTAGVEFVSSDAGLSTFTRRRDSGDAETDEGVMAICSDESIVGGR